MLYLIVLFFSILFALGLLIKTNESYQNWDFMDLPNYCPKVKTIVDVPRFGGVPNPGQVWNIDGRCNCGKFFKGG